MGMMVEETDGPRVTVGMPRRIDWGYPNKVAKEKKCLGTGNQTNKRSESWRMF